MKGIIQSAVLRAEYLDNYILDGNFSTCQAGNMEVVWGVLDLYSICQSQLNLIDSCSLADWPGCWVFNYAREPVRIDTVNMVTSQGMNSGMTEHPLAKTFIEIDITNEVEYIISNCDTLNSHAYAIYYEVLSGTGVAETYGFTNCSELEWWQTYPESWTRDGNTTHIVVEGDLPKNPDVGIVKNPAAFDGLSLSQNNPNPFNPTTTIRYNVPSKDKGMLSIYTVQGKLVLAKEVSGRGAFQWDARGLGSGVYVYKLKTGGRVVSKRALFVR
ncbi:MAG: hypothetical protein A3J84_07700 [Ignavibacteria bacterium RIFOXYA2_FULL_37_17]|nr:MAG: hypothetical protein A3J84_07700 [Ignavibacteria bacterium RIFOXYA2_FULL_37_17]